MMKKARAARPQVQSNAAFAPQPSTGSKTLADQVTAALFQKVQGNEFEGSRLPSEQAMAEGFGVSRTVIREAISRLKAEGLIDTKQGRGAFVRADQLDVPYRIDLNSDDVLGSLLYIIELRRGLDAEIATLAAQRRKREQMAAIRRALAEIDRARKEGEDAVAEDLAFHLSIAHATANPLFPELLRFLNKFLVVAVKVTRANEDRRAEFARQVRTEHMAIAAAIERQDPEAAATAAKTHMINAAERIKSADAKFWAVELPQLSKPGAKAKGDSARTKPTSRPTRSKTSR